MANLTINIGDQVVPPIVHDNFINLNTQVYTFDINSFIKGFTDPEGGTYNLVTIKSLIGIDGLKYNASPILIEDSFPVANSGLFEFTLAPKYSIHNGVLYEYTKDIDLILADYEAIGYKLVANTNGLLTFIHPDTVLLEYVQGIALANSTLAFEFTTSSDISGLPSNVATFSMIPWENVNLKDNFYSVGGGTDGDSAYQVAVTNGFVGTQPEWIASLEGAIGPAGNPGATGADGANGTSVTIKGEKATTAELPTTGNAVGDGYIVNLDLYAWDGTNWILAGEIKGPKGNDGRGLEYTWNGTSLGVRYEGQVNYVYSDLKGATGLTGEKGLKGDQGLQGLKGDTGAQGIQGIKGDTGLTGAAGTNGSNGSSAYQVWLDDGNSGTEAQYLLSLKGDKGDTGASGEAATFTHKEVSFDWLIGQSQVFPVADSALVTDVYVDGKRVERNNPNNTPDEWEVATATSIRIIPFLNNNDRITIVSNAKYVTGGDINTIEAVKRSDGTYLPIVTKEVILDAPYTHPTNHPPSIITQDTTNRFVTDVEKATWNAKVADAPLDGLPYSRKDNTWVEAPSKSKVTGILSSMLFDTNNYGAYIYGVATDYSNLGTVAGSTYYNNVVLFQIGAAWKMAVSDNFQFDASEITVNFREIGADPYPFGDGYLISENATFNSQQGTYKVYDLLGVNFGVFDTYTLEKDLVYEYHRRTVSSYDDTALTLIAKTDVISYALSSPTADLTAGDTDSFIAPYDFTLNSYFIGVMEAPTGSSLVVDLKKAGVSVTSTNAAIDATETTSLTGTAPILTTTSFLKGDKITSSIVQVGATATGKSLKIYLEITKS